jgi:TolB-like protein/Flp pilus assembly protein TadD
VFGDNARLMKAAVRTFWGEVRRRHVVRVAAYYVAGAWIMAQVASLLFEAFDAGHYTRYVIAALAAGLPVALVLAWIFDVTPHGIERTLARGAPPESAAPPPGPPGRSIAVLPFANLSDDPSNEYFSDGLAEEIRNQLARVPGLRVTARSSSFAFKGRHEDVREIGRRLNVATLLEGGVRKQADTVRIDVQIVGAHDGYQVWSQSFERRLDDIFRLQSEVACAVIAAVSEQAAPREPAPPPEETRNFAAYNAYLLGRHFFHRRTEAALRRAVECFEQAVALDAGYALAYSGLSDATMLLCARYYGSLPAAQAISRALQYAERSLELAPALAEAHASLGMIRLNQDDFVAAEAALLRALELDPAYALARVWLGLALTGVGRYREAAARNREAFRLDPLSPILNSNVGFDSLRFGDLEEAEVRFRTAMEIEPSFPVPYSGMSRLATFRGDLHEALRWNRQAVERAPGRVFNRSRQGLLQIQVGDLEAADEQITAACCGAPGTIFDEELLLALRMVRRDTQAVRAMALGEASPALRAQAWLALDDAAAARRLYEQALPDARTEVLDVANDDWIWRMPHTLNLARLWIDAGDPRGHVTARRMLAEIARVREEGVALGDLAYRAAAAHALLGQTEAALAEIEEALRRGWRHAWWARLDGNLRGLPGDPRFARLLERAAADAPDTARGDGAAVDGQDR